MCNEFVKQTMEGLIESGCDKDCLSNGFSFTAPPNGGRCILILGMNPAGDKETAKNEKSKNFRQYYYLPDNNDEGLTTYSKYFKPIYEFANSIYENNAKWDWCNDPDIKVNDLIPNADKREITVLIGDMFYYHETSQDAFKKIIDKGQMSVYLEYMLELHIKEIVEKKMSLDFIYINNATLSNMMIDSIFDDKTETYNFDGKTETYKMFKYNDEEYRVFFGGMLSGQRALDKYSRIRLVEEIKSFLKEKQLLTE